jgi:hypothetical protein
MEKIKSIKEGEFKYPENSQRYDTMDGYIIETTNQTIKLGIDNCQQCCEEWGYFLTEDDPEDFIGAKLLDIKITDTLLREAKHLKVSGELPDELHTGNAMFVDLITDRGVLQFVAYNEHNGFYGHDACVISKQLKYECMI